MSLNIFFKKISNNKSDICLYIGCTLFVIATVLLWPMLFYATRTVAEDNSCQVQVEIDRVEVVEFLSGPTIYIYTEDICYECNAKYTTVNREELAQAAADRIKNMNAPVTLTVLDFYPRNILFARRSDVPVESRGVGLQSDTEILWDTEDYNSSMRLTRVIGIFVCAMPTFVILLPLYFNVFRPTLNHLKERRKNRKK